MLSIIGLKTAFLHFLYDKNRSFKLDDLTIFDELDKLSEVGEIPE